MKKILFLFRFILCVSFFVSACKKNGIEEESTEIVQPVIPDLSTQIYASVNGFITDENGQAVEAATVKAGAISVTTDAYGFFKISNAAFKKSAGFIQVTKAGYFEGFRTFLPREGKQNFIRLQLITKTIVGTIDAATGGTVNTSDAASVTLPSNAVVVAASNTAYSGQIHVAAYWLDPSNMPLTSLNMPGDLRGIDQAGHMNVLTTFGMLAVELMGDAGELLQVAAGKKASLKFPIPSALQGAAPASIPLWYFDESHGLWKEDGVAVRNGNNYQGDVTHFTYWNCDAPNSMASFKVQFTNMEMKVLSNVAVSVSILGTPNSTRSDFTDENGEVFGYVPANSTLHIEVASACNVPAYSQNITTTNAAVNLGSVKIQVDQYGAEFKGTAVNCSSAPITNGYVIIASALGNHVVEIENGNFVQNGLICPGTDAVVIAFDRETLQRSTTQNVVLQPGLNDLGSISVCMPLLVEEISYVLDGVSKTLGLPQHLFNANWDFLNNATMINAIDLLNGSALVFGANWNGPDAAGVYTINGTLTLDQDYIFLSGTPITVTNYGLVGEFITASFNANLQDVATGNPHTFSCTINVRRDM